VCAASRQGEVRFDWTDPETWEPAVAGVAGMYLMAPHGQPVEPAFVRLAVDEGVRRIVLLSSRGIEVMGDERLIAAERTVRASGAEWAIVRPDWFNQNFDEGFFQPAVLAGQLALPLGDHRDAFVDADDIAAVADGADRGRPCGPQLRGDGAAGAGSHRATGLDRRPGRLENGAPFRRCTRERRDRCSDASGP
jgi:uncharacterized protein YbjT (DUF2867 family)